MPESGVVTFTRNVVKLRSACLSILFLLVAANSLAASLGRHRGATLIGRPLDISVQAVLDSKEDIASLCLDADVFYADNRLDKSRVRVTAERGSDALDAVIRIRSTVPVDEPVVTVYVRLGCQQKIERRYVTLADMPSEAASDKSMAAGGAPVFQATPALVPPGNDAAAQKPARNTRANRNNQNSQNSQNNPESTSNSRPEVSANSAESGKVDSGKKNAKAKSERAVAAGVAAKPELPARSRLKLEPLDLTVEREPQLKSSNRLLSVPSVNPQERSAAAALWQAIAMEPPDILRDLAKLQTLESSVRSLQAQSQKTQQSLNDLDVKLQKAEADRYANPVIYALGLLLFLALATLAYLLLKQPSRATAAEGGTPWWRKREASPRTRNGWSDIDPQTDNADNTDLTSESARKTQRPGALAKARFANPEIDLDALPSGLTPSKVPVDFQPDSLPSLSAPYRSDFGLSMSHPSRAVKAEELFDVHQQADFFVSIGQHEQAIDVLKNHVGDDAETSAVVYLDLFNLYHQLGRKNDYEALREEFNSHFNTQIPEFELYTVEGPGLEAYQLALSRIEALWPSPKVLEVIEDSIFKSPESEGEAFSLQAYRELLMLYSVAKEIIGVGAASENESGESGDFSDGKSGYVRQADFSAPLTAAPMRPKAFVTTAIQPLSASIVQTAGPNSDVALPSQLLPKMPPASFNLGLDVDLSQPAFEGERRAPIASTGVYDSQFFAALAGNTATSDDVTLPPKNAVQAAEKWSNSSSNLIDFDPSDIALGKSDLPKPPKL